MLNITRKPGEGVSLTGVLAPGQQVLVSVHEIRGQSVKFGVSAPQGIRIHRCDGAPTADSAPAPRAPAASADDDQVIAWASIQRAIERTLDRLHGSERYRGNGAESDRALIRATLLTVREEIRQEVKRAAR
jgi:sRNA-binding carbon storage regulator CsrA